MKRRDHVLWFDDKKIEVRHEKHCVSFMWEEVGIGKWGEIESVRF